MPVKKREKFGFQVFYTATRAYPTMFFQKINGYEKKGFYLSPTLELLLLRMR